MYSANKGQLGLYYVHHISSLPVAFKSLDMLHRRFREWTWFPHDFSLFPNQFLKNDTVVVTALFLLA